MVFEKTLGAKCMICEFSKIIVFSLFQTNLAECIKTSKMRYAIGLLRGSGHPGLPAAEAQQWKESQIRAAKRSLWCQAKGLGVNLVDGETC